MCDKAVVRNLRATIIELITANYLSQRTTHIYINNYKCDIQKLKSKKSISQIEDIMRENRFPKITYT
jgi:hypothetical protein